MSFRVGVSPTFKRKAKRLVKKYASLREELLELVARLEQDPEQGTPIGNRCFKIRIAIKSKGGGKSGGARVITCVIHVRKEVHLLTIYDKSEQGTITARELRALLLEVPGDR
jgi:mRNA-degrading endonuclease RelE of RelBE toxin-antitoxin system